MNTGAQAAALNRALTRRSGKADLVVIYDGQCIFCNSYIKLMRLRQSVGTVLLLDARRDGVAQLVRQMLSLDLDEGMLVLYGGRTFYGADAMHILSALTSRANAVNAAMAFIFSKRWLSRNLYPILKAGRSLALFLLARPRIQGGAG